MQHRRIVAQNATVELVVCDDAPCWYSHYWYHFVHTCCYFCYYTSICRNLYHFFPSLFVIFSAFSATNWFARTEYIYISNCLLIMNENLFIGSIKTKSTHIYVSDKIAGFTMDDEALIAKIIIILLESILGMLLNDELCLKTTKINHEANIVLNDSAMCDFCCMCVFARNWSITGQPCPFCNIHSVNTNTHTSIRQWLMIFSIHSQFFNSHTYELAIEDGAGHHSYRPLDEAIFMFVSFLYSKFISSVLSFLCLCLSDTFAYALQRPCLCAIWPPGSSWHNKHSWIASIKTIRKNAAYIYTF